MFRKFNLDTEWAVRLISRITNDEDIAIESNAVVKQVRLHLLACQTSILLVLRSQCIVLYSCLRALLLNMQLLGLQINAEKYYFGIRKSLVEFDEVLEVYYFSQLLFMCIVVLFPGCYTKF
jgi:preprotein translocase subunit SecA